MKSLTRFCLAALMLTACTDTVTSDGDAWRVGEATSNGAEMPAVTSTEPEASPLGSAWVQGMLGNCIDIAEWLVFEEGGAHEHVWADRNACEAHSVDVGRGEWSLSSETELRYEWRSDRRFERRLVTFVLLDDGESLNTAAFVRRGNTFTRMDEREFSPGSYYEHRLRIDVTFGQVPSRAGDVDCYMNVRVQAEMDLGANAAPLVADEKMEFECTVDDAESNRLRIRAKGSEDPYSQWSQSFSDLGIWDRHAPLMASLVFSAFRPDLYIDRAHPDVAFTSDHTSWWTRSDLEPPRTLAELEIGR